MAWIMEQIQIVLRMFSLIEELRVFWLKMIVLSVSCLLGISLQAQPTDLFPQPTQLKPAVDFWIKVYTEVDTQSGFLHDSQNLSVIYTALELDRRVIERERSQIQEDLRVLAGGKRSDLSRNQQEVLQLWPADVSNETLRTAANNVRWKLGKSERLLVWRRRS